MKNVIFAFGLAGLLAAGSACADVGVTANLGTTGFGAHFSVPVQPSLNARFGVNALHYSYDDSADDLDYDFKLKLQTVDALLDWFPAGGVFRLTAGVVYNGNKIDARAKPNAIDSYTINGRTYSTTDVGTLNGKIDFRKVAPYLGIGWGNAIAKDKGWGFSADLGVLLQGSPKVKLSNSDCRLGTAQCDQLAADIAAEQANLKDDTDSFRAYPVIRVGVSYKF